MEGNYPSSDMLLFLEHMPLEKKQSFPRNGPLAFNIIKYQNLYRVSMGEMEGSIYVPYALGEKKQIPDGKTIDDVVAQEVESLGENIAFFNIFLNNTLYKKAATPFMMPL